MIEKITDQNLERYDSRLKEWCDRKFFEKGNYGKYETTEESGAVAFYPAPNTPLEGKVKFSFKETMPANGDKGPDNPSTITGISFITVTHCETEGVDSTDYTIQLGDTYYGGTVDFTAGVMTVTWYGTKLTSTSNFRGPFNITQSGSNKRYATNLPYGSASYTETNQACSHYNYRHSFDTNIQQAWVASSGVCYIYDTFETLEALNTFLDSQNSNDTPVMICYQLATPFTVQLTPIQILSLTQTDKYIPRLNTVYTDADSVQISYLKSPIRDEYEKTQAILSLGGNS